MKNKFGAQGLTKIAAALALVGSMHSAVAGTISEWYVNSADQLHIDVLQGNAKIRVINEPTVQAFAIAVSDTVRTMGSVSGRTGNEFTLSGAVTGATYGYIGNGSQSYWDGTTDGRYNYAWDYSNGKLVQFSLDWKNPTVLFGFGLSSQRLGITYDPANDSFWVSGWGLNVIQDFSRSGQLLSSFTTANNAIRGFAMDYADNTLWGLDGGGNATQWSRTGQVLSTASYSGPTNALGGEFKFVANSTVPEPATVALFSLGLLGFVASRRKAAKK